jgi:hypothetical protein
MAHVGERVDIASFQRCAHPSNEGLGVRHIIRTAKYLPQIVRQTAGADDENALIPQRRQRLTHLER